MTNVSTFSAVNPQNPNLSSVQPSTLSADIEMLPVGMTSEDGAPSRGVLYWKRGTRPKVGVHLMHPRVDHSTNYNIFPLVDAGYMVLGRSSRWPGNDCATIYEKLLVDVAAGIKLLQERGCHKVVLLGNSGGGSLAAYYQAQARKRSGRETHAGAGDEYDLNRFDLPPAHGVILIAAHVGQGNIMARMIDPSVIDENDPEAVDPSLDMYDPANGFREPPSSSSYDPKFLSRYESAQLDRIRRLDAIALGHLRRAREAAQLLPVVSAEYKRSVLRRAAAGHYMIIHRTTADPAYVDPSIGPSDRVVGSIFGPRPDLENYNENGFGRYLTPAAWLSSWSPNYSRSGTKKNLSEVQEPLLIINYAADQLVRSGDMEDIIKEAGGTDKTLHVVRHTDHYGYSITDGVVRTGQRSAEATRVTREWMQKRFQV